MLVLNAQIMKNLMCDLLDLAQMENNTFKLNKAFFSFPDLIKKAFSVVSHVAQKKSVQLIQCDIPPQEQAYYNEVYGDQGRFLQVIINFLSNSLKFSENGSKIEVFLKILENQTIAKNKSKLRIKKQSHDQVAQLSCFDAPKNSLMQRSMSLIQIRHLKFSRLEQSSEKSNDKPSIEIEPSDEKLDEVSEEHTCYMRFQLGIRDFGCGISSDKLGGLFINFNNLEEHRKTNPTGRGLGLSICKMIVEQMGGSVNVESTVG